MSEIIYCSNKSYERFDNLLLFLQKNNVFYSQYLKQTDYRNFSLVYSALPYLDKNIIKAVGMNYFSNNHLNIFWEYTSGSNGIPFKCFKTSTERNLLSLYIWNCRRKIDRKVSPLNFLEVLGKNADRKLDFSNLSSDNIVEILNFINYRGSRWLCLSPTMAYHYAVEAVKLGIKFKSLKFLELQGEFIDKKRRSFIERAFNAKTVLQYGMRETWTIAYECPHGHLRLLSDLYEIEISSIDKNGFGEAVISSNVNKYMPFIKYKTGDILRIRYDYSCECGYQNPCVIEIREGREANCIYGHSNLIADIVFKRIIRKSLKPYNYDTTKIKAFRVLQTAKDKFTYIIVKGENYCSNIEYLIVQNTKKIIDVNAIVDFKYEDKILLNKNGKQKLFKSECEKLDG